VIACLSLAELCASTGVSPKRMRVFLADFEAAGIVERDGDRWRLTSAAAAEYAFAFRAIRASNVPLEPGDDDGLDHCKPGPAKAAA
jgi:DNA-binding IclR family transcriptional regulator